jgi:probable F420-dependent oxidoreductase
VKFGLMFFATEYAVDVAELARAAESLGYESLFLPEHTHIPVSRKTPWPGGVRLTEDHKHLLDPLLCLAAAAAVTSHLRLGTGICLVTQRDPIILAKQVASLDVLSRGRFIFGVSAGWNSEELLDHGTDPARRLGILNERIAAMKRIWTEDAAEFHGEYVNFDPIWSWPKPVQRPYPPILLGGNGPTTLQRVVAYYDGWAPNVGQGDGFLATRMAELDSLRTAAGRAPIPVTALGGQPTRERIARLTALGVERWAFRLPTTAPLEAVRLAEGYARMFVNEGRAN